MKETISTERLENLIDLARKWEVELKREKELNSVHYKSTVESFNKLKDQIQQLEWNATNLLSDFRI